jgi:hypothetical protein
MNEQAGNLKSELQDVKISVEKLKMIIPLNGSKGD